jgi:hypothetical protein
METSIGSLLTTMNGQVADQGEVQVLRFRSLNKAEIEVEVQRFIETGLEQSDSGTLYVFMKQLEYAIKTSIEHLKDGAFNSLGEHLGGLSSGRFLGHDVSISYPSEWHYSQAVETLKETQKKELTQLQDQEKQNNTARRVQGKGRITVTLRDQ